MQITTLKERIEKAEARIAQKNKIIRKKQKWIAHKKGEIANEGDIRMQKSLEGDVYWLEEDIKRLQKEIAETQKTIEKYQKQLAGELEKERLMITEMPEEFKELRDELVSRWDSFDKERKTNLIAIYGEVGWKEFFKDHTNADYEFMNLTDEQIHKSNEKAAEDQIINLYNRVKDIVGEVTSWEGIHLTRGTWNIPTLNGVVIGKMGRASVESITAGGYNIQRLHIRVLVHSF